MHPSPSIKKTAQPTRPIAIEGVIRLASLQVIDPSLEQSEPSLSDWYLVDGQLTQTCDQPVARTIDLADHWICPGFIDLSHHVREPGYEPKGTLFTETSAAAASGFTHLACPPVTEPINDSPAVTRWMIETNREIGKVTLLPIGALTQGLKGEQLSEMAALKAAGCVAVTNADTSISDHRTLLRCYEYAASVGLTIFSRPEDADLSRGGHAHAGAYASRLGIPAIPSASEALAVARDCILAEETGARIHFSQISSALALKWIRRAQQDGLPISCDVAMANLLYTDETLTGFNALYHTTPPLRSEKDRQALLEALSEGHIHAISSNHRPHEPAAKMAPFCSSEPGLATLDSFVPDLIHLTETTSLSIQQLISAVTNGAARCLDLPVPSLHCAGPANAVIINPKSCWQLNPENTYSMGHNNPRWGNELRGQAVITLHNGQLTYLSEKIEF
jgi:dihydroorotase